MRHRWRGRRHMTEKQRSVPAAESSAMALLEAAQASIREGGSPMNGLRQDILRILWREGRPMAAYDLLSQLEGKHGRKLGPPVVYRSLEFLIAHGLAARIRSRNAYLRLRHPPRGYQPVFLLCDACGNADEIDSPGLESAIAEDAGRHGFQIVQQVIECSGICAACRSPAL